MNDKVGEPTTREQAHKIMCDTYHLDRYVFGTNFHDVEVAEKSFGYTFTDSERKALEVVPFSPETLYRSNETHLLLPLAPLSILDLRTRRQTKHLRHLFVDDCADPWLNNQDFAREPEKAGWLLLRWGVMPGSFSKTWIDQLKLLESDSYVPSACSVIQAALVHFRITGLLIPLGGAYFSTGNTTAEGKPVSVYAHKQRSVQLLPEERGSLRARFGIGISTGHWSDSAPWIGLAEAKKPLLAE